jgi:hypothetical protein
VRVVLDAVPVRGGSLQVVAENLLAAWTELGDEVHLVLRPGPGLNLPANVSVHEVSAGSALRSSRVWASSGTSRNVHMAAHGRGVVATPGFDHFLKVAARNPKTQLRRLAKTTKAIHIDIGRCRSTSATPRRIRGQGLKYCSRPVRREMAQSKSRSNSRARSFRVFI